MNETTYVNLCVILLRSVVGFRLGSITGYYHSLIEIVNFSIFNNNNLFDAVRTNSNASFALSTPVSVLSVHTSRDCQKQ